MILSELPQVEQERFNYLKEEISKQLKNTRSIAESFKFNNKTNKYEPIKGDVVKYSDVLSELFRDLWQFFKDSGILAGIHDKGTCTLGERLFIKCAYPRKRSWSELTVISQYYQGSTSNYEAFERIQNFLSVEFPELNYLIYYDCGTMD